MDVISVNIFSYKSFWLFQNFPELLHRVIKVKECEFEIYISELSGKLSKSLCSLRNIIIIFDENYIQGNILKFLITILDESSDRKLTRVKTKL